MCKIERKIKNDTVTLSTRISRGFDKNGKRLRKRYSLKLDTNEYQTEKQQDQVFKDYLIEQGVNEIQFEEKENEDHKKTESEVFDKESDLAIVEDTQTNELTTRKIVKIPLEKLQVFELNPSRPSQEFIERLASSIYEDGLNNPIHVVKYKDKYLIQKGNKRYKAYQFLNKKYDSDYDKIECYILDYEIEDDKKEIDPMFTLQLMRDNINTYERTLNDKILEVELYHKIFPELKKKKIASGRENEWIAKEMGIADKSVKDYLKLLKVDDVRKKYFNKEPIIIGPGIKTGIRIKIDNPKELGADRLVDAAGAYYIYGGSCLVIDFGTATTFDVVDENGDFLGGATAPGIGISINALSSQAAKLPEIEIKKPKNVIAKNTVSSMQAGIIHGYVGLTENIIRTIKKEYGKDLKVISTGGLGRIIFNETALIDVYDPDLTFKGLKIIYDKYKKTKIK